MLSRWLAASALVIVAACQQSFNATPGEYVGTWARSTGGNLTCGDGSVHAISLTGNVVIALGTGANEIIGTQPNGCATLYDVTDNTATEQAGQSCPATLPDSSSGTVTNQNHILTLVSNLVTIDETETATEQSATMSCTGQLTDVFAKQQ